MKRALICGVSGQDGAYLAQLLIEKGYQVWGTSRDAQVANFGNLAMLGINDQVNLLSMAQTDFRSVLNSLSRSDPDEVYFLSGQSSVGLSFGQPAETIESISFGILNLLEAIRFIGKPVKVYNSSSSESFGDVGSQRATEVTPFRPRSPYGVAKASAYWLVTNYREAYGLFACNGILFNHESPLRPSRFVTKKIMSSACRISRGSGEKLNLGRIDIVRDWGWAPEYVEAMWRILQAEKPDDFVIATGYSATLEEFVTRAFDHVNLDWRKYVVIDSAYFRPSDIAYSRADPSKAAHVLNWRATTKLPQLVDLLISAELTKLES
ncbi:MAG: GDP-mannose 4,6-dehydratase [Proteobacteria bacterium]|nr:GDP-mannose 4,6-dehydratase [Pseudomonadota bacterium]